MKDLCSEPKDFNTYNMAYKRKLSLRNLLDMWPKYGHLSNLAEIMEFSALDVARQHRKPRDGPAF